MKQTNSIQRRLDAIEQQTGAGAFVVIDQRAWRGPFTSAGAAAWHADHVAPALARGVEMVVVLRRMFDDSGQPIVA